MKGRIYCLRGQTELIALDGDTGAVDWTFSAPSGQINPCFLVGADRTVLEVDTPNQLLVLRTDDGRPTARLPLEENERLQRIPLPVDEDSVLLVTDLPDGQETGSQSWPDNLGVSGEPGAAGQRRAPIVRRFRATAGLARWSTLDPPRPGDRLETLVLPARDRKT